MQRWDNEKGVYLHHTMRAKDGKNRKDVAPWLIEPEGDIQTGRSRYTIDGISYHRRYHPPD